MGDDHDMYGHLESGEFNPFDGEPNDDPLTQADLRCFNCEGSVVDRGYPYLFCSEGCTEEAHTIRYVRGVNRDGRILDPLVLEAVQIRIGMVLGGGYSKQDRALSPKARAAIIKRDQGRCQLCGAEGTQIDHINADLELARRDINDPANLQLVCDPCHRKKTLSTFKPLEPEHLPKWEALMGRIESPDAAEGSATTTKLEKRVAEARSQSAPALVKSLAE